MIAIISLIQMIMSMFGYGTGLYSQVQSTRQMYPPRQVYRQCPQDTTPQAVLQPDGTYRIDCVQEQSDATR
jgi:hypothetical protein